MFNVGGGELLVILLVALIVLGPQRLPEAARKVGKVVGDLRRISAGFQNEMRAALDDAGVDPSITRSRRPVKDIATAITAAADNADGRARDSAAPTSHAPDDGGDGDARAAS